MGGVTKNLSQQNVWSEVEDEKQNEIQMFDIVKNGLVPKTIPIHSPTKKHNIQPQDPRLTEYKIHHCTTDSGLPLINLNQYTASPASPQNTSLNYSSPDNSLASSSYNMLDLET